MPQVNDIGVALELVITKESDGSVWDISAATTKQIKLKPPRGAATITKTAAFSTTGSDGKIRYVTESGVLNVPGTWKIQGYVVIGGTELRTEVEDFIVGDNA